MTLIGWGSARISLSTRLEFNRSQAGIVETVAPNKIFFSPGKLYSSISSYRRKKFSNSSQWNSMKIQLYMNSNCSSSHIDYFILVFIPMFLLLIEDKISFIGCKMKTYFGKNTTQCCIHLPSQIMKIKHYIDYVISTNKLRTSI
jgi:hypothetical protein